MASGVNGDLGCLADSDQISCRHIQERHQLGAHLELALDMTSRAYSQTTGLAGSLSSVI
jgi:hypothetical protein